MKITNLKLKNFKSFDYADLNFEDINILIGPNASGKSNLVSAFLFLKDLFTTNLENAISIQGGINYLRNIQIKNQQNIEVEFTLKFSDKTIGITGYINNKITKYHILTNEIKYKISLENYKTTENYKVADEYLSVNCSFIESKENINALMKKSISKKDICGESLIEIVRKGSKIVPIISNKSEEFKLEFEDICPSYVIKDMSSRKVSSLNSFTDEIFMPFVTFSLDHFFSNVNVYDIDTSLPKQAVLISGKSTLEKDGSNFAVVLKKILKSNDKELYIKNINQILDFISDVKTDVFAEKYLMPSMKEKYNVEEYLPAILLSDGTIYIASILIPVLFEENTVMILEEPFIKVHPKLFSQLMKTIEIASEEKQFFITTHNPILIKNVNIKNIYTFNRDDTGYTKVIKYINREDLINFIDKKMNVDYLFVKGIL